MSIEPIGPETETYNNGGITSEDASQSIRSDKDVTGSLETLVSRQVWACSTQAARWERLIALREGICAGTYRVSAADLAACLLRCSGIEPGAKSSMYSA